MNWGSREGQSKGRGWWRSGRSKGSPFGPHFSRSSWKPSGHTPYRLGGSWGMPNLGSPMPRPHSPIGFPRPLQTHPAGPLCPPSCYPCCTQGWGGEGGRETHRQAERGRQTETKKESQDPGKGKRRGEGTRHETHSHKVRPKTKVTGKFWKF